MSLKDAKIQSRYRSSECKDFGESFISVALKESVQYKRAAGFFSSSSLINESKGISYLAKKKGAHIKLVVSPNLSKEDIDAINRGYENRNEIITKALVTKFDDVDNVDLIGKERLNFLCHLIECNILDIKVAYHVSERGHLLGMYHEKIGVFIDEELNKVAFNGSLNESGNSFLNNFESVSVFNNWSGEGIARYAIEIENDFDMMWDNNTSNLEVIEFPEAAKNKLFKYRTIDYNKTIDDYEKTLLESAKQVRQPFLPDSIELRQYQKDAIRGWNENRGKGIFDMCTGSGKTFTAYATMVTFLEKFLKRNKPLVIIVVCPYTHLVDQWVEDQEKFGIQFIVGYSSKKLRNYKEELKHAILNINSGISKYVFFITTNSSFITNDVQKQLKQIKVPVLFVADEVHNFGAPKLQKCLNPGFKYRLGLSATVDRYNDEFGTKAIYDYFGKKVISYSLENAIADNFLCRYFYHVVPIVLLNDEKAEYVELTKKISKFCRKDKSGKVNISETAKMLLLKRARIIAGAQDKVVELKKLMTKFKTEHNMLVYCGTAKREYTDKNGDAQELRELDEVTKILGNELGITTCRFTSRENNNERDEIKRRFVSGNDLQAIVAIKCLDEGVNIPSIKKAFILASSTNPREYIQRRGRVLRKYPGKNYAYIYDFVSLPRPLDELKNASENELKNFTSLARKEIIRVKDFAQLAENSSESDSFIEEISEIFDLDKFETEDYEEKEIMTHYGTK